MIEKKSNQLPSVDDDDLENVAGGYVRDGKIASYDYYYGGQNLGKVTEKMYNVYDDKTGELVDYFNSDNDAIRADLEYNAKYNK